MRRILRKQTFSHVLARFIYRGSFGVICSAGISMGLLSAADIAVNQINDSGASSLRQGLSGIQSGDRLVFQPILNGTILDNGPSLNISGAATFLDSTGITLTDNHAYTLALPTMTAATTSGSGSTAITTPAKTTPNPLTIDWNGTLTLNGVISDTTTAGGLVKNGTGTLVLSNANTYSGGTTINGGTISVLNSHGLGTSDITVPTITGTAYPTLSLGNGVILTNNIVLSSTLILNAATGSTSELSGVISGPATTGGTTTTDALQTSGGGTLIFSGTNTFTGGVTVNNDSTIRLTNSAGLGTGAVTTKGVLTVDVSNGVSATNSFALGKKLIVNVDFGSSTLSGAITQSSASGVTKNGAGTLNLTNSSTKSTYTGGTIINGGTLIGNSFSLPGNITLFKNTALIFNQPGTGTYAGTISGTGDYSKSGNGTLVLSGSSSLISNIDSTAKATMSVNSGELQVTGTLTGPVNVTNTTALLSGTGTVGSVTNHGIVEPGASGIGQLTVTGNFVQGSNGTTQIKINSSENVPGTNNDQLAISGQANLGGQLKILATGGGSYTPGTQYTIINAAGGVTGQFAQASSNLSMFGVDVIYDANDVKFQLQQTTSLGAAGITGNQISVGNALDHIALTSSGSLFSMINTLGVQTPAQQRSSMNQLSGQTFGNLQTIGFQIGEQFLQKITSVLVSNGAFLAGGEPVPVSNEDLRGQSPTGDLGRGWIQGYGVGGNLRGDGNGAATNYSQGGALFGFDGGRDETGYVGVAGGSSIATFHDSFDAKGQINSYQLGVYALKHDETGYILGAANYGYNSFSTNRNVAISGANQSLHADFWGNQAGANLETGLKLTVGRIYIQPLIGMQYLYLGQQRFNETGGPAALTVGKTNANSLRASVGARFLLEPWQGSGGAIWSPYSHVRFVSDLLDNDHLVNASFNGAPVGGAFVSQGTRFGPNYGVFGEGLEIRLNDYWSLFGGADVMVGDRVSIATGSFGSVTRW
jgi:fibronectin-binding autotransporter adhesin